MTDNWKLKYFEKNNHELHINIFRSLEAGKYLKQAFKKQGFSLHRYKLNFSDNTLNILVSIHHKNKLPIKKTAHSSKTFNYFKTILKDLNKFTNNNFNITITAQIINTSRHHKNSEKFLLNFDRYNIPNIRRLYVPLMAQKDSARLLVTFIAKQLEVTKRHSFFFSSLKESLTLLVKQKHSKIQGIKILIKGRSNNAARSKNLRIVAGKISIIKKNLKIDYFKSTAFTSNGTIGIKVWISEKLTFKCFYNRKKLNIKKLKRGNFVT